MCVKDTHIFHFPYMLCQVTFYSIKFHTYIPIHLRLIDLSELFQVCATINHVTINIHIYIHSLYIEYEYIFMYIYTKF